MTCEEWRPVVGWEGLYEVSSLGRVKTIEHEIRVKRNTGSDYSVVVKSKLKKLGKCNTGYLTAALSKGGRTINVQVHTMVAEAFIPNPNHFKIVNHIDGDKTNNNVNNLEWCSYRGNNIHSTWIGINRQAIKVMCVEDGKVFPSLSECNRYYNLKNPNTSDVLSLTGYPHPKLGLHFQRVSADSVVRSIDEVNKCRKSDCNFIE